MPNGYLIRLDDTSGQRYAVWMTADIDRGETQAGFPDHLLSLGKRIVTFSTAEEANRIGGRYVLELEQEACIYDLGMLRRWAQSGDSKVPFDAVNDFWNLCTDAADSLEIPFYGNARSPEISNLYNQVFYALNLPALRGNGEYYTPTLSRNQIYRIKVVMKSGLTIWKRYTIPFETLSDKQQTLFK